MKNVEQGANLANQIKRYRMVESEGETLNTGAAGAPVAPPPNMSVRSSRFKYYIHDGIEACRLQLLGELTGADIPDLKGCWRTARTTLGKRKLILDLRGLQTIDEAGQAWVSSMAQEGAACLPSSFEGVPLPQNEAVHEATIPGVPRLSTRPPGRLRKLLSALRILPLASAQSPTQVQ